MKKYSIIAALFMAFCISMSSCAAHARVSTKHHSVGAGAHVG
jgi:hypothetical protein